MIDRAIRNYQKAKEQAKPKLPEPIKYNPGVISESTHYIPIFYEKINQIIEYLESRKGLNLDC